MDHCCEHHQSLRSQIKTEAELSLVKYVRSEGKVCARALSDDECRIATRLVRRGVLSSRRCLRADGTRCGRQDYIANVAV